MSGRSLARHSKSYFTEPRLRVLVDMDMVLCDFEGYFLQLYREKFQDAPFVPLEERKTFYICDQYEKIRDDLPDKARSIFNAKGFIRNLPEIQGACSAVKEMAQMENVDVFICTSPLTVYKNCVKEKFQWVEEHLGKEWISKIILTKDKTMINGHLLIDDRPSIQGACQPPSWQHIVFTAWYNCNIDLHGRRRLNSWTDGQWQDIIEDFKKRI